MQVDHDNNGELDLGHKQVQPTAVAKELLFDEDRLKIYYNKIFPF